MRFSIFLLVALALFLAGAEAKYSPGLEIASGAGIKFSGTAPASTAGVLYSDSGTLMFGDNPVDNIGLDTVIIRQNGTNIISKSSDGHIVSTGTIGTDDLEVLNDSRDYCHANYPNGATIAILNGSYTISTFEFLYSNLTLYLKKGVVVEGDTTLSSYPVREYGFPSYTDNYVNRSMFWAQDVSNIAIVGEGELDGNGEHTNFNNTQLLVRPFIVRFCNVTNFRVGGTSESLKIYNAAMWTQHYLNCSNGILSKQTIDTNKYGTSVTYRNANLDGLDIDCCNNVMVSEIDAKVGDDAICLKASGPRDCGNITISECTLSSAKAALKFGTETNGGFQNIVASDINIYDSICGFGLTTVDGGNTYNIQIHNINMYDVNTPFYVRLGIRNRSYGHGSTVTTDSKIKNVVLRDISVSGPRSKDYTSYISGYAASTVGRINGLSLSNFQLIDHPGGGTATDAIIIPPELTNSNPSESMFGTLPAHALYVRHVVDSSFQNLVINQVLSNEDRPVAIFDDLSTSSINHINTQKGSGSIGRVFLNNNSRNSISSVSGSSGYMFRITGSTTNDLLLLGNDCAGTCTLSSYGGEVTQAEVRSAHNPD
jgi:polygalacturonase